jgi:hypothetical protein
VCAPTAEQKPKTDAEEVDNERDHRLVVRQLMVQKLRNIVDRRVECVLVGKELLELANGLEIVMDDNLRVRVVVRNLTLRHRPVQPRWTSLGDKGDRDDNEKVDLVRHGPSACENH